MKFKVSISAEVDFTELLSPENVSGAMLALGAKSEVDVVKKFAENMLSNTQIYTADFTNVYNVTADVSQIEQEQPPQTAQNIQEDERVEGAESSMSPEEQRALIEKMQQIRHYQELERQAQAQEQEQEQGVIVGEYTDVEEATSPEPEPVDDSYYLPETDVINHETANEEDDYSQDSNEQVVDTHDESNEVIEDEDSFEYKEEPQSKLAKHLFYLSTMEMEIDSVVVKNQELKDYILNGAAVAIAEDDIIVREDLGQDFVIRYLGEENNMIEVGE